MTTQCVVEGCNLEYDVVCSFSFYSVNTTSESEQMRQQWIDGALHTDSECLWKHVSLQLCGYHFELDAQGLWIDSPMLPELLTVNENSSTFEEQKGAKVVTRKNSGDKDSYQGLFEEFIGKKKDWILSEHNYSIEPIKLRPPDNEPTNVSRLNVRQLVDTLGYLSMKNLQRKQMWVVKVETERNEGSITQTEQVIQKMTDPAAKQIIEIIPPSREFTDDIPRQELGLKSDPLIHPQETYEIAQEQEISGEEGKEVPQNPCGEWTVKIVPDMVHPKYAYIKHCNTGKKKRHFTSELNELALPGDFENYYILPDADPSVGVEVTTSYEPENYIVDEYDHLVLQERDRKRSREDRDPSWDGTQKKRKKRLGIREQVKQINEMSSDWTIDSSEQDYDETKKGNSRVRRKNKKYLGYDFVT